VNSQPVESARRSRYNPFETEKNRRHAIKSAFKTIVSMIALMWFLNGCQAMTGQTLGENIDDTTITTTVKAKLAAEKGSTLTRVGVDTNRGVVQLSGVVSSAGDRSLAERVARGVGGVKSVVNNLQIQ
jgi:hyperosmotically inducible periplasmic protein